MKKFIASFFVCAVLCRVSFAENNPAVTALTAQTGQSAPAMMPAAQQQVTVPMTAAPQQLPSPLIVSGYVRLRALVIEKDVDTFRFDECSLVFKKDISEKAQTVVGALLYGGNTFFLEHAYLDLKDMPLSGILRIGATRNNCFGLVPVYPNRKTTNYGMVSDAFTHDRILGVQYLAKVKPFDINVGIHNGYDIGTRTVGEGVKKVTILADRDKSFTAATRNDTDKSKECSARIAFAPDRSVNVGVSGTIGRLSLADLTTLNPLLGTAYTDRRKMRAGVDCTVTKLDPVIFQGECYEGWTSELQHMAYQGMAGYLFKKDGKPWIDIYARYGELNPDIAPKAGLQATWKLAQTVLSCVYRFTPGAQLQLELEKNDQKNRSTAARVYDNDAILELTFFY